MCSGNGCWVNWLNEMLQEQWTHPCKYCSSGGSLQDKWHGAHIQMNPLCSHSALWADNCGCWWHTRPHLLEKNKGDCVWNDRGRGSLSEVDDGQDLYVIVSDFHPDGAQWVDISKKIPKKLTNEVIFTLRSLRHVRKLYVLHLHEND